MAEPHSSNFRVITTNFLDVRMFRKFTVQLKIPRVLDVTLFTILKTFLYKWHETEYMYYIYKIFAIQKSNDMQKKKIIIIHTLP